MVRLSYWMAHALAAPNAQQPVDRAHSDIERLGDRTAQERIDWAAGQTYSGVALERTLTVERLACSIDYPPEQLGAHRHQTSVRTWNHARVRLESVQIAGRHQI